MLAFALPGFEPMLDDLKPLAEQGSFKIGRFENGELFVNLMSPVRKTHCALLGSVAPPDERLLSLALLAHTLKKEGCSKVTAFLPYLGYSRQDKDKRGQSLAAAWVGAVLRASGVDAAVTIDVHSQRDQQLFPIPLISTFPAEIFANAIRRFQSDATIVAPDNGAIPRCQAVNAALGRATADIPYLEKIREETGIKHTRLFGVAGPRALIVDDMLDTGGTLISACENLLHAGTREIYVIVTHGLFTGTGWKKLWSLGVKRIFCTSTIPSAKEIAAEVRITILPIAELLREQFAATQNVALAG